MTAFPDEADLSKGYVLAFRRAWENPAFLNLRDAAIWQYIFQNAVHEPEGRLVPFNGRRVQLQRGQFITSIRYLAEGFKVSEKVIRRALAGIEEGGLATLQKAHSGTILSVCKYDVYQPLAKAEGTPKGTARAHRGHTEGTNTNQSNKEDSKYVGVTYESGGCRGAEPTHRNGREWSPKTNHPDQFDLITDTALAADYQAPAGEPVAEVVDEPEPELPLMLSAEGEIIPSGELVPVPVVTVAPEATAAAPAPTGTNVVPHETMSKKRAARGGGGTRWELGRQVPPDWVAMAYADRERLNLPWANLEAAAADFSDYWPHQPGAAGMKLDWQATWRRWARTQRGGNNGKHHSNKHQTGPNVNGAVFAAIFEQIAGRS